MADSDGSGAIETDEIADFIMDLLPEYNFQEDDILAVFELDLPGGLSEVSKAILSCSPEHIVGNCLLRRLWNKDRQVSQESRLIEDNALSIVNLHMVYCKACIDCQN